MSSFCLHVHPSPHPHVPKVFLIVVTLKVTHFHLLTKVPLDYELARCLPGITHTACGHGALQGYVAHTGTVLWTLVPWITQLGQLSMNDKNSQQDTVSNESWIHFLFPYGNRKLCLQAKPRWLRTRRVFKNSMVTRLVRKQLWWTQMRCLKGGWPRSDSLCKAALLLRARGRLGSNWAYVWFQAPTLTTQMMLDDLSMPQFSSSIKQGWQHLPGSLALRTGWCHISKWLRTVFGM